MDYLANELLAWLLATDALTDSTNRNQSDDSGAKTVSASVALHNGGELVQVQKELFSAADREKYSELVSLLAHHALRPALGKALLSSAQRNISYFELLFSRDKAGNLGEVIHLSESYRMPFVDAVAKKRTFGDWLVQFQPVTREDYRLTLPLYSMCRNEKIFGVPTVSPTPDRWLDSMLRDTRGMLLWTHQWEELLRVASDFPSYKVAEVMREIKLGRPKAAEMLEAYTYEPTGQTLAEILAERSPFSIPIGHQDHLTGDWLWQRLAVEADQRFSM